MLDFENSFTADEYVQFNRAEITTKILSNEEILKAVLPNNQEEELEELNPLQVITHNEVIESYDKVILYLEQWKCDLDPKHDELKMIRKLKKEALKRRFIFAKQTKLNSFINNK